MVMKCMRAWGILQICSPRRIEGRVAATDPAASAAAAHPSSLHRLLQAPIGPQARRLGRYGHTASTYLVGGPLLKVMAAPLHHLSQPRLQAERSP